MKHPRSQSVELVNMCLITDPNTKQVLVQDKTDVSWRRGLTFPGGHVEVREDLYHAMVREVREETGLSVHSLSLCGTVEWFDDRELTRKICFLYRTADFSGTLVQNGDEGVNSWKSLNELTAENTAESIPQFLKIFLNEQTTSATSNQMNGKISEIN